MTSTLYGPALPPPPAPCPQLFDLFTLESQQKGGGRGGGGGEARGGGPEARGIKAMLESLPELWEGEQYEQEYDLTGFMRTLRHQP